VHLVKPGRPRVCDACRLVNWPEWNRPSVSREFCCQCGSFLRDIPPIVAVDMDPLGEVSWSMPALEVAGAYPTGEA
jgi:hypothetical protein